MIGQKFNTMSRAVAHRIIQDFLRLEQELGRPPGPEEYDALGKYGLLYGRFFPGGWETLVKAVGRQRKEEEGVENREPRILLFDLETAPMELLGFGLYDQNFALNQIKRDWFLLSLAAKWLDKPAVIYADQRAASDIADDTRLLRILWGLLNEADIVVTQNGKSFDEKVANARFIIKGFQAPAPFKHIDTKQLAKRRFRFTSNKLEYLAEALNVECKKSAHKKFPGFELWAECLKKNPEAWAEMKAYNVADVLALEGVYLKLRGWGTPGVNLNLHHSAPVYRCECCGSTDLHLKGHAATATGLFRRFQCQSCGKWGQSKGAGNNLLTERKKMSLKGPG